MFLIVNLFSIALLYGRTGRLAAQNGAFRPWETPPHDELKEWSGQLEPEPEPEGLEHALALPHRVRELCGEAGALPWGGPRLAVWFGNESRGLSRAALRLVRAMEQEGCMTVRMLGMVESLNIAATVAVCLTEVTRQRSAARTAAAAKGSAEASSYGYEGAELEALVAELVGVARRKALGT